jgi:hypothetical protein
VRSIVLAIAAVLALLPANAAGQTRRRAPATDDLSRARVLDKEGVKAFGEGRYNDAIRYFEEAHRLGGPPFELWNIAKCHLRLDQPEQAAEMLERYLETPNLPPDDRKEASEQLDELRRRPSTLTVSSSPTGATVSVDGKTVEEGKTPVSITVAPGPHTVVVSHDKHTSTARQVEARYGRAVIVDVPLAKDERPAPPQNPYADQEERRIALRGIVNLVLPRYGGIGGDGSPGAMLSGTYRLSDAGPALALGGLFAISGDSWRNTVGAPSTVQGCNGTLPGIFDATAISIFGIGTAGFDVVPRLRVVGVGGIGVAAYAVPDTGGDLFIPSCTSSPGLRPAVLVGAQVDYAITGALRLTAMPISMQLHPAFAGVRTTPIDASGVWLRFGLGIGVGVAL